MSHSGVSADLGRTFAVRLMQHLVVPTFVLDNDRRVIIWNKACEALTGVPAEEIMGTSDHWQAFYQEPRHCLADLVALGETEAVADLYVDHTLPGDDNHGLRAENWCVMPRAKKRLYLAIDAGPIYDDDGRVIAVVETLRDMTEAQLAKTALESLAHKDGLTGLANRRAFDDFLEAKLLHAQREKESLSLLLMDVDHFKPYNDTYGHQQGDECLKAVAGAIAEQVFRPVDLAARYGGEEFAIVLPTSDLDGAQHVAERVREAVKALNVPHGKSSCADHVTLSIGVASCVPDPDVVPRDFINAADACLYAAKHKGRDRVHATGALALGKKS